jgi:hypothetical protein
MKYSILIQLLVLALYSCNYCKTAEKIALMEIIGIVESKSKLEWNRDEQIIVYKDVYGMTKEYEILMDNSGFWDFVEQGDSLYKPNNIKTMRVYRNGKLAGEFLLDIGCSKHLKDER